MESREEIMESETERDVDFNEELTEEEEEIVALSSILQDIARKFNGVESDLLNDVELEICVMLEESGFLRYDPIDGKVGTYLYGM